MTLDTKKETYLDWIKYTPIQLDTTILSDISSKALIYDMIVNNKVRNTQVSVNPKTSSENLTQ